MAAIRQQDRSRSSSSRLASAYLAAGRTRSVRPVRWGAAVVEPHRARTKRLFAASNGFPVASAQGDGAGLRTLTGSTRRQLPIASSQMRALAAPSDTAPFTQNRIRHAFELFGACMMIVTFLALAMFA